MKLKPKWIGKYYPIDNFTEALVIGVYYYKANSAIPELVGEIDHSTERPIQKAFLNRS